MAQSKPSNVSFATYLIRTKEELHSVLDSVQTRVNWTPFKTLLSPIHDKTCGRKSYPALSMFKCLLLQNWYNLSDYELERSVDDRLSFRRFVGLEYTDSVPDHSSFSRFRDELVKHNLESRLFDELSKQIEEMGLVIKKGTLVDASIVQADVKPPKPSEGKAGRSDHDRDASWTKKNGKSYFGYKMHVGIDQGSGLIRKKTFTPANVHDTKRFNDLVSGDEKMVYADKGYVSSKNDAYLKARGITNGILFKNENRHPLYRECNRCLSRVRSGVETLFGILKRSYGYRRVRYRNLAKNALQFTLLCMCYNLKKVVAG
jgi:IS5 family transposase